MIVVDSRVKFTCPSCSEIFRLEPAAARTFAATLIEAADGCEETMVENLRHRLDAGGQP